MFNPSRVCTALSIAFSALCATPAQAQQAPQTPSAQEQTAATLLSASDWPAAVVAYRALATAEPANPRAVFGLGVALHETGKYADAIESFTQAESLGFQPINQARFRKARAYAKAGDTERALATLEQLATAGFANTAVLSLPDLNGLRELPRFKAFETRVKANARPCDADPNYHAFDFWIGEWDVQPTTAQRGPLGSGATSVIERQLDGCVIQENWLPQGPGAGKSFNIYNSATKQWEQYYVDTRGTITLYTGTFRADGNLYFEARSA